MIDPFEDVELTPEEAAAWREMIDSDLGKPRYEITGNRVTFVESESVRGDGG